MKRLLILLALLIAIPAHAQNTGRTFQCHMVSTATSLTMVTGCDVVTGNRYFITDVVVASSVISTAANYFILSSGTGTACATTNTARYGAMSLAFTTVFASFRMPVISGSAEMLCFTHAAAGTKDITITGYLAP
jgi:NhaP-type Na+/H+ and K+/H+ antiporter